MHWVQAKLTERERKTGAEVIGINMEIKDKMETILNSIERMREALNTDKSNSVSEK
jgi:hypothetical protein